MADLLSTHKFLASNGENNTLLLKLRLCFRAVWGSEEIFPKNYPQEDIVKQHIIEEIYDKYVLWPDILY